MTFKYLSKTIVNPIKTTTFEWYQAALPQLFLPCLLYSIMSVYLAW